MMSLLFGVVASSDLVIGVFIGVRFNLPKRVLAILLSFAAGPSSTHWLSNSYAYKRRNES